MKIVSIVGTRPQWIKLYPVELACRKRGIRHVVINTGQHYDYAMDKVFIEQFKLRLPDYNLGIGSVSPSAQIAKILEGAEPILKKEKPDIVLVYGDTNSTLGGAMCAVKLDFPAGHVEAGLRSFDRKMPEEINRVAVDHLVDYLFAPTRQAMINLKKEGLGGYMVGDPLAETLHIFEKSVSPDILKRLNLYSDYIFATIHRNFNTDDKQILHAIVDGFIESGKTIVFSVHPRTEKQLKKFGLYEKIRGASNIRSMKPLGYLETLALEKMSKKIITDSGGVQREAALLGVPCYVIRKHTEFTELLKGGRITLLEANRKKIAQAIRRKEIKHQKRIKTKNASMKIIQILMKGI